MGSNCLECIGRFCRKAPRSRPQLELAVLAAFRTAKDKGKSKGKGKSKVKFYRSNLTLEQKTCQACRNRSKSKAYAVEALASGLVTKPKAAMVAYIPESADSDGLVRS